MGRLSRNYAILAKTETTYGTDSVPTGGANALLVTNLRAVPLAANNVDRNLVRPYFGASEQLIGVAYKEVGFEVELVGGSAAGTAPAWGPLLKACGWSQSIEASTRVDYLPITTNPESVTIYVYLDGVLHKLLGARGDWSISAKIGEIPRIALRFQGLDGGLTAASLPSVTLTAWQTPQVVTDAFTPDFKLGATVNGTGAPAFTGGTDVPSTGITLQSGNTLAFTNLIGLQEMDITDRQVSGTLEIDQTASQEVSRMTDVLANTLTSISMRHGTVAGRRILMHLPSCQMINPAYGDVNGRLLQTYDLRCVPAAGNDELRITAY